MEHRVLQTGDVSLPVLRLRRFPEVSCCGHKRCLAPVTHDRLPDYVARNVSGQEGNYVPHVGTRANEANRENVASRHFIEILG